MKMRISIVLLFISGIVGAGCNGQSLTPSLSTATPFTGQTLAPLAVPTGSSNAVESTTTRGNRMPDLPHNADGYVDLTVEQLAALLKQKNFTLVNVHIPYEGELPNTDLFVPFNKIKDYLDKLPAKDAPIVLYCRSGRMSTEAAKVLAGLGYTNVFELNGGFNAWKAAGYALLRNK